MHQRITLYKIVAPLGTASNNEAVWKLLDQDVLDGETVRRLAGNGLRVGLGKKGDWAALAKRLDVPGVVTEPFLCQTDARGALTLITRSAVPQQTLFILDRAMHLQGRSFDYCAGGFRLGLLPPARGGGVRVLAEPVLVPVNPNSNRALGVLLTAGTPMDVVLSELELDLTLPPDGFLLLAPMDLKASPFSVGARFLATLDAVPATETLVVVLPDEKTKTP